MHDKSTYHFNTSSESSTDGPESSARLISCLQKVKRGQLKETRKEKLTEKLSHKLLRKIKQIRVSRRLRRQSREDPETVALLPPAQTKETKPSKSLAKKAQTRETSLRKKKKKVTSSVVKNKKQTLSESLDESSVSAHDAESLVEDRDLDSDKMPLLLRNRATEKKRRQVEARRLRRQRRKVND